MDALFLFQYGAAISLTMPLRLSLNRVPYPQIQNNCLTSLPESLATLGDLKVLLAHGNFISEVPCLGTCLKLEDLQLNENATSQLPDDVFLGLPALHNLDLVRILALLCAIICLLWRMSVLFLARSA
jgi:hypothetical protein